MEKESDKSKGRRYLMPSTLVNDRNFGVRKIGQITSSPKYWMPRDRMETP